jgi:hypothetical protein
MDWDGFVNFVDRAINETRSKRPKVPEEPEERKRLRIFKTTEFSITECDSRYLGRFDNRRRSSYISAGGNNVEWDSEDAIDGFRVF